VALVVAAAAPAAASLAAQDVQGIWEGAIVVLGTELGIVVRFAPGSDGFTATIDIPMQGAFGLPLRAVRYEPPSVHFELPAGPGLAVFDGRQQGDSIGGAFAQSGATGTFWLRRQPGADRPSAAEPTESLPYTEEEVRFGGGAVTLAGTLTVPGDAGPHPAVVLLSGSGPQNRDEELFGFRPFRILADRLARRGIVVLRYDDRGVGGSTGSVFEATAQAYADDARAGLALLRGRREVAAAAVGLLGHSEGAIVAALSGARPDGPDFLVLLAGPAMLGGDLLMAQAELIARAAGAPDDAVAAQRRFQETMLAAVRSDSGWAAVEHGLDSIVRASLSQLPADQRAAITDPETFVRSRVEQQLAAVRSPWFRFFAQHDPADALARVRVPVLALFGEKDLQVPPDLNQARMARALAAAGNRDVTIEVIPSANHLFQQAVTGSPAEYATLEKSFVPGLVDRIADWILATVRSER
jgi:hypothetical protein